mgnify:CR=1 FL=1
MVKKETEVKMTSFGVVLLDRCPIQFRQHTANGEIQMRVDDAMVQANCSADLTELMNKVVKQYPTMPIQQWVRADEWSIGLFKPCNLN